MRHFVRHPRGILFIYSLFVAVTSAVILAEVTSSPSEAERAVAFGLSMPRLAIALSLLAALGLFVWLGSKALRDQVWAEQFIDTWFKGGKLSRWTAWLSGLSLGVGWIGCFLPAYRLEAWSEHWVRIQPAMIFILLAGLGTLMVFIFVRIKNLDLAPIRLGLPIFAFSSIILGILLFTRFGIASSDDFWYGAGVPILVSQLIAVIFSGLVFLQFESRWKSTRVDVFICLFIYILTAVLWSQTPLKKSFFFTEPSAPNGTFFPFADAALFDTASQFSLIGERFFIYNSTFFERPLYLSFIAYLHALFGQNYEIIMAVQAGIFAILPVLIFLIGRSLDLRAVGFASAVAAMLRGLDSLAASNLIDMANPKVILTDFPAAIGVVLIVLLTCEWLKEPSRKWYYPLWLGGAIGFTLMLRTNALMLFAFIPLYALIRLSFRWKQWLLSSFLILLGVVAITITWEFRNLSLGGMMYGPIVTKFQNVIQTRYEFPTVPDGSTLQHQSFASMALKNIQPIIELYRPKTTLQENSSCDNVICFSANHFLHNVVTSLLIFPTSPFMDDLRYLVKERSPYWQLNWDGSLIGMAMVSLFLNLFFITLGVAVAWKRQGQPGLTPLFVFIVYNVSNGLARTSGGRYIVPVDWIVVIYYLLGILWIITWVTNMIGGSWKLFSAPLAADLSTSITRDQYFSKSLGIVTTLLLLGALIPLSENLYLPRYQNFEPRETLLNNRALIEQAGLNVNDLDTFLQTPDANILIGRALYPRFYKMNQGEFLDAFYPYNTLGFPRTAFKLIGPAGDYSVILPGDMPEYFPHASDVLVLGCNGTNYFDAVALIILGDHSTAYARQPQAPLQCPVQPPVCNNNSVCQ